jgi:arylsulfatase A-like enzyme
MPKLGPRPARCALLVALVALVPLACGDSPSSPAGAGPAPAPARNVLLFVVDTLRADRLGCYGYGRDLTPAIDALAARGALYEQARSQGSNTRYSMISLLSGLWVTTEEERLPVDFPSLAERVRAGGRDTAAFIGNGLLAAGSRGFERGFDHVEGPEVAGEPERSNGDAEAMVPKFLRWRAARQAAGAGGRGWFAWVHVMDPHVPYVLSPPERRRVQGPLPGAERLRQGWDATPPEALAFLDGPQRQAAEASRQVMLHENDEYDAEVAAVDAAFARLVAELEAAGELQDTLIVFAADHGEALYERLKYPEETRAWFRARRKAEHNTFKDLHLCGHGWSFHDQQWHVPLVLAGPGIPADVRQPGLAANVDIYPTVLAAFGLLPHEGLPGTSLLGGVPAGHDAVFGYTLYTWAVFDERGWKYVDRRERLPALLEPGDVDLAADGPALELFNMAEDPHELRNLHAERPREAEYYASMIREWRRANERSTDTTLTDKDLELLRQLGYVGEDARSR